MKKEIFISNMHSKNYKTNPPSKESGEKIEKTFDKSVARQIKAKTSFHFIASVQVLAGHSVGRVSNVHSSMIMKKNIYTYIYIKLR